MKLYMIPHPWDYHENGAFVLMAESEDDAREKLRLYLVKAHEQHLVLAAASTLRSYRSYCNCVADGYLDGVDRASGTEGIKWGEVVEVAGGVYSDGGCDD